VHEYGISTSVLGKMDREESLRALVAAGFAIVELAGPESLDGWISDPVAIRHQLEAMGLRAASVHLPPAAWNVADPDDAARRAAVDVALASLPKAAAVGAEVAICHPNGPNETFTEQGRDASLARARESLEEMAAAARAAGIRLALENIPHRHLPRPGSAMADILALIDGLGDHVGVCLDAGHSNANGFSAADDARLAGKRLFALHIQDNDGRGDDQHLIPGEGTTDWAAFLAALEDTGFRGVRTFEVAAAEDVPGTLAALRAIARQWNEG